MFLTICFIRYTVALEEKRFQVLRPCGINSFLSHSYEKLYFVIFMRRQCA